MVRMDKSTGHRLPGPRADPAELQKHSFVAVHHRPFRKEPFNHLAGVASHPSGNRPVRQDRKLVDKGFVSPPEEKTVTPRDDHLRCAADL